MHIKLKRPAVAMVELIFAIVIMGIVLMSAPMLISTATSTTIVALQQEGVNEAVARINEVLTYDWDENSKDDACIPPVLHVSSGDDELNEIGTTGRRVGVPLKTKTRTFKCQALELDASSLAVDGKDDIDDFAGTISLIEDTSGSGGKDYIESTTVNIATTVSYIGDGAAYNSGSFAYVPGGTSANSTNIKQIGVTLTSTSSVSELDKTITLNAFSCNIGGYEYASRELP